MERRSERQSKAGMLCRDLASEGDVIQVVSGAFDVLHCCGRQEARLSNLGISSRCGLPRSTVTRLTDTLTGLGQPRDQNERLGSSAVAMIALMLRALQLRHLILLRLQEVAEQLPGTERFVTPDRSTSFTSRSAAPPTRLSTTTTP